MRGFYGHTGMNVWHRAPTEKGLVVLEDFKDFWGGVRAYRDVSCYGFGQAFLGLYMFSVGFF